MSAPKLKPCPFCGGEAKLSMLFGGPYFVRCQKCLIEGRYRMAKRNAIAAWNRRVGHANNAKVSKKARCSGVK